MTVTVDMAGSRADAPGPHWRRLDSALWAGRDGTRMLGTIERGHHYTWVDADGTPRGRYPTLEQAQAAASPDPPAALPPTRQHPIIVTAGLLAATAAMLGWTTSVVLSG